MSATRPDPVERDRDAARAPRRSRGDAAGDSAGRDRRAGRRRRRRQPGLHAAQRRGAVPQPRRTDAGRRRGRSRARGDILYANARFAALVGEPLESVVGSRIDRFVNASDRDEFASPAECRQRPTPQPPDRRGLRRLRGQPVAHHHGVGQRRSPESDRDAISRELLEANSNRDRAERDNRTKDEFLAMLAHELRNPLGAISSAVRVLELDARQRARRQRARTR